MNKSAGDPNNWGGVQAGMSPNMQAAIDLVKQTEATVPTQTGNVVVTGGSMGGIGTEAAMVEAGPKGTVDPGVFASGLAYDGALYNSDAQAATTALCGVPFTMVHGTADTTVPYQYDQALAATMSGCPGFTFVPVQGATHGTWNNPDWQGYGAGTLIDNTLAAARGSAGATASPATVAATPAALAAVMSAATRPLPAPPGSGAAADGAPAITTDAASTSSPAQATPGQGTVTDCAGHVWTVNGNTKILEDGIPVVGTSATSVRPRACSAASTLSIWLR